MKKSATLTQHPFEEMKFRHAWRSYQQRILHELESHLDDDHLHVVAAPGSGKTILGLEVMRRLNRPSLILAPTIAIRNQWMNRLVTMFLPEGASRPGWLSKDIRTPGYLTVTTYQALHAALSGDRDESEDYGEMGGEEEGEGEEEESRDESRKKSGEDDILSLLKEQGVSTIVLDEAHHLRKEWWKALTLLKESLGDVVTVSLTATPPYDVDRAEWERYEQLCGPIDAEISVPELVKSGDLCPHQDYVCFSTPVGEEAEKIREFRDGMKSFLESLKNDSAFMDVVAAHDWVRDAESHVEDILAEPRFFSSIIIFLNACGFRPPGYALDILGVGRADIPELDAEWLEVFLTGFLYTHAARLDAHKEKLDVLRTELKRIGAIERRKVVIGNTKAMQKMLSGSLGKLESILQITRSEVAGLGDNLRMVVLADYIRKAELPQHADDMRPMNKIGVVPIFEHLRRSGVEGIKLGVLTGSIIIVPAESRKLLMDAAASTAVPAKHVQCSPLAYDKGFLRVEIKGEQRQKVVHLVTEVFSKGGITVLVGTQALLGEGWDSPSVNTLVLASYVGSYMLSNQMRGRAIRIDPDRPSKVANVWHLAAVDAESVREKVRYLLTGQTQRRKAFDPFDEVKEDLGHDVRQLIRRFKAFEGVSFHEPFVIENGFRRLGIPAIQWNERGVRELNDGMLDRAGNRDRLPRQWEQALAGASTLPQMREKALSNSAPTTVAFLDTIRFLAANALLGGMMWGVQMFRGGASDSAGLAFLALSGFVVMALYALPGLLKALYLWMRNGTIEGSIRQVGWAVLESLQNADLVKSASGRLKIETTQGGRGVVCFRLDGATTVEQQRFLKAMQDVLSPVENPRYLLVRQSYLGRLLQVDYHAVPEDLGQNKKDAEFFAKKWKRYVGHAGLAYTRTAEGRKILLKARTRALSSAFRKKTDRLSIWE